MNIKYFSYCNIIFSLSELLTLQLFIEHILDRLDICDCLVGYEHVGDDCYEVSIVVRSE